MCEDTGDGRGHIAAEISVGDRIMRITQNMGPESKSKSDLDNIG